VISVPPAIPAAVTFHVDYQTGLVVVSLVNVDRFDRVSLEFHSQAIDESVLEDLIRFILGKNTAFLRRSPLAGIHGTPQPSLVGRRDTHGCIHLTNWDALKFSALASPGLALDVRS